MKNETIKKIEEGKIVAIMRGYTKDQVLCLADALIRGGIATMEITYIPNGDYNITSESIKLVKERFKQDVCVGAGTVLYEKQVIMTRDAGGEFIISPNVKEDVIKATVANGLVSIPGALTPSECVDAYDFGADYVKLFPIDSLGLSYFKALRAPLSHIKFMAVGGVSLDNAADYIRMGAYGLGIGGNLGFDKAVNLGDYSIVTDMARRYVDAVKSV